MVEIWTTTLYIEEGVDLRCEPVMLSREVRRTQRISARSRSIPTPLRLRPQLLFLPGTALPDHQIHHLARHVDLLNNLLPGDRRFHLLIR